MPRTVTALYDSRGEAETARARLVSDVKTRSTRLIAKDTAAAVDGLDLDAKDIQDYRDAIRQGCHLLVAEIEPGQDPERVLTALEQSVGAVAEPEGPRPEAAAFGVTATFDKPAAETPAPAPAVVAAQFEEPKLDAPPTEPAAAVAPRSQPVAAAPAEPVVEEARIPLVEEELRIDKKQVSRGGARVHTVVREAPAEEQVALSQEQVEVENRPSERRLSIEDLKAGGLLRERIFEIREMREEPVITKEAFVREEVIVRKTVQQRTETIRDTVRRTEVEVQELPVRATPPADEPRRGFFGGRTNRK